MAPTIRIKREDAIKALEDTLAQVQLQNNRVAREKMQYQRDKEKYTQILKDRSTLLVKSGRVVKVTAVPAGSYDAFAGDRATHHAIYLKVDASELGLPECPQPPKGNIRDTDAIESQLRLLKLATDDVVPVSLFKDLQNYL